MRSRSEKGGGSFTGIKLLLCENPLPPIEEAIAAAQAEVPRGNYYTEAYSAPLRRLIGAQLGVPERLIHINAGSELILRQLFDRFGAAVHLLTPTYPLFPEIARRGTERGCPRATTSAFDLASLGVPPGTTLARSSTRTTPMAERSTWRRFPGCSRVTRARASWSTRRSSGSPANRWQP